jgi:hypothetical protein
MLRFTIMSERGGWVRWVGSGAVLLALSAGVPAARATPAGPSAPSTSAYEDPTPIRIYRFHVYSTMKQRWKKKATIDSLVITSSSGVVAGDRGQLERRIDPAGAAAATAAPEWVPFASVTVKKLLPKGRLELEIDAEVAEAKIARKGKLPFSPGQKVRLQIDRVMGQGG